MTDIIGVKALYNTTRHNEWDRLEQHRMEFHVTLNTILKHLPPPPARVADIGGGPGRYSLELARLGYQVTLIDLSPVLLDIASSKAQSEGLHIDIAQANACDLSQVVPENDVYDAVLLLGPLYHLVHLSERRQAIVEALRILKKKSTSLFCTAYISRLAHFRDIAMRDPSRLALQNQFYRDLMHTGDYKQLSYHARPRDVIELISSFPVLKLLELRGCEGFLGGGLDEKINLLPEAEFQAWLELILETGTDEEGLANSDHLLAITKYCG
ncbi:S-adenosyl-L-methionine-dependent methyltransferase [Umbelopsis sp. PMI_123]|nr:S-adenosyl-L-methionine-dependent methyltransferase [Umbelopsis sp. PMI_123]